MEADIILDGFLKAGQTHDVRYTKFIGDGEGSVFPILSNKWCQYGVGAKITNFRAGRSNNYTVVRPFLKKGPPLGNFCFLILFEGYLINNHNFGDETFMVNKLSKYTMTVLTTTYEVICTVN